MDRKLNICAMIPARIGSSRLKYKNFALLDGKPLIFYAINAAKQSAVFDNIVLNSDDIVFKSIADRYGIDFYLRQKRLGSSITKSDEVVSDFITHRPEADIVVWVNSIAPLMDSNHIKETLDYFVNSNLDSLITSEKKYVHANFLKDEINYSKGEAFAQTQNLQPVELFNYCLMMWRVESFKASFRENEFGLMCGNFSTYSLKGIDVIIKTAQDLQLAEKIMISKKEELLGVTYDDTLNFQFVR